MPRKCQSEEYLKERDETRRTDFSRPVDMAWLYPHFTTERIDDTRTIRANEARLGLTFERVYDLAK
jgi:hypothetical protein